MRRQRGCARGFVRSRPRAFSGESRLRAVPMGTSHDAVHVRLARLEPVGQGLVAACPGAARIEPLDLDPALRLTAQCRDVVSSMPRIRDTGLGETGYTVGRFIEPVERYQQARMLLRSTSATAGHRGWRRSRFRCSRPQRRTCSALRSPRAGCRSCDGGHRTSRGAHRVPVVRGSDPKATVHACCGACSRDCLPRSRRQACKESASPWLAPSPGVTRGDRSALVG